MSTRTLETRRLILRPWREEDAESLFRYASDPAVGPAAGWPAHTSVENSREVIRTILSKPETWAVVLKEGDGETVGSVGIFASGPEKSKGEPEIGYWIGVPFWGRGLIPEAVEELLRYCFEDREEERVWCAHFEGNAKSRRVIEKCGFKYVFSQDTPMEQLGESRMSRYYRITKEEWRCRNT